MTLAEPELKVLTEALANPSESDVKVALSKVAMEVNSRLQSATATSAEYMNSTIRLLKRIPGAALPELRINCLLDASHFFYLIGQTFSAIEPAADATELATQVDNKPLLRKGLTFLGMMHADTGNISRAVECYAQALDLAQALRDRDAEGIVWINLGVAYLYAAQYRDAIACLEHVIQIAPKSTSASKLRSPAFANIALCCLHLEDFSRGLKAAEICVQEAGEPHTAAELVSRVLRENYYIRLLLEVNSIERAGERCEFARKYAARSKSARADIAASIAEGLYEVHAGRVDVGISRLTGTLERARLLRSMLRDTLAALVKAYEIIGQPERALIYLREMMEALRKTQQENALRHIDMHLEQLGSDLRVESPITTRLQRQEAALQGKVAEQELFRSRIEMLERLAVTAELRDDSTGEHSYRVGKLSALLAQEFVFLWQHCHHEGRVGWKVEWLVEHDPLAIVVSLKNHGWHSKRIPPGPGACKRGDSPNDKLRHSRRNRRAACNNDVRNS